MKDVKPKKLLQRIKYRYLEWKWDRVLKKSYAPNWESYFRKYDPDFNYKGYRLKDQFCGYPHIALVPIQHLGLVIDGMWGPMFNGNEVVDWCKKSCKGKFRWEWVRAVDDHRGLYASNGSTGEDRLFIGFKDERDYLMFMLRWS